MNAITPVNAASVPLFAYPKGIVRWLLRLPLLFYRAGLGELANAARILVLTTRGRKSGLPRYTAIEYRGHGSKLYLISGWGTRPDWVRNLQDDPLVAVQQGSRYFAAHATVITTPGEALRVVHLFRRRNPTVYDRVLAQMSELRDRDVTTLPDITGDFTIVRLDRLEGMPSLPMLRPDLTWLLPTAFFTSLATAGLLLSLARVRRT